MKELPLYDPSEPIACTLDAVDAQNRKGMLVQMREATTGVVRTEAGVILSFPSSADDLFAQFSVLEKQCCAFFGFEFESGQMQWEAPPQASAVMDDVFAFFVGTN